MTARAVCLAALLALAGSAWAQCLLALNVTSPLDWQAFRVNQSIWVNFTAYNATDRTPITTYNVSMLLDGAPLPAMPFNASPGVHSLLLNVSAAGCTPTLREIKFYVLPPKPALAVPNIPAALTLLIALLAYAWYRCRC